MQLRNVFQISLQLLAIASAAVSVSNTTEDDQLLPRAPEGREVIAMFNFYEVPATTPDGKTVFPMHSSLFIEGTKTDGPLRIEVRRAVVITADLEYRVLDYGVGQSEIPPPKYAQRMAIPQGKTTLTNNEILNLENGEGPVQRALAADTEYRSGPGNAGNLNTCHNYNARLVKELGFTITDDAASLFNDYDEMSVKINTKDINQKLTGIKFYNPTDDPRTPKLIKSWSLSALGCSRRAKRAGTCSPTLGADVNPVDSPGQNELALNSNTQDLPPDQLDITASDPLPEKSLPITGLSEQDQVVKVGLVRSAGTFSSFASFSKAALSAMGVAGTLAGTAFIILDFVDHNWVGGAIGAVGLAAGIATSLALSGPVGWIVGGVLAALFASKFVLFGSKVVRNVDIE